MPWSAKNTPKSLNERRQEFVFFKDFLEKKSKESIHQNCEIIEMIVNEKKVAMKSIMIKFMKHDE